MNLKEAEERAQIQANYASKGHISAVIALDFLALADLARRLAKWAEQAHIGHPNPKSCYGCKLAAEAREAGLLKGE
jgi:hypothetical protein